MPSYALADIGLNKIAQVNNVVITQHDLDAKISNLSVISNIPVEQLKPFQDKILQDMIKDEVFLVQATKMQIKIDDQEITEMVKMAEREKGLAAGTIANLMKKHPDISRSFKAQIAKNHLIQYFVTPKIIVTQEEIAKQLNKGRLTLNFTIASLLIDKEQKEKLKDFIAKMEQEVENCNEFENFVNNHNMPPLSIFSSKVDDLNETLKSYILNLNNGQLSQEIPLNDGSIQFFMVCDKQKVEEGKKTEAEVKEEILNKKMVDAVNNYYLSIAKNTRIIMYKK